MHRNIKHQRCLLLPQNPRKCRILIILKSSYRNIKKSCLISKVVDILLKMSLSLKSLLVVAFSLSAIYLLTSTQNEGTSIQLAGQETSANLDDASLKKIRNLIKKAGTQYQSNYDSMASFIQGQLNTTIASTLWNVVVFSRQDADRKFTTTLTFLGQKKYYEVYEPDNYTFSVRIL